MFKKPGHFSAAMLAGAVSLGAMTAAQAANENNNKRMDLGAWDQETLYKGWSADEMLDEDVYGSAGDEIGEVEDFLIGPDGKIAKVVVEGGGFLDIGDSHVAIPYNKMKRKGAESFTAPLTEENLEDENLGMFAQVDDMPAKPAQWRVRELIGDTVMLKDGRGYGRVDDVIFAENGSISSVIVRPSYGYGYGVGARPMPFYADQYEPYSAYYKVPYTLAEVEKADRFNYGRLDEDGWEGEAFGAE